MQVPAGAEGITPDHGNDEVVHARRNSLGFLFEESALPEVIFVQVKIRKFSSLEKIQSAGGETRVGFPAGAEDRAAFGGFQSGAALRAYQHDSF